MILDGFSISAVLLPVAILAGGFLLLYSRRNRNSKSGGTPDQQQSSLVEQAPRLTGDQVYEGHGGTVVVHQSLLAVHRHGMGSFLTQGIKGEKRIPFRSITAVQFKSAGRQMAGYIQFSIAGGIESRAGIFDATLDENTVMFTFEQNDSFLKLRDLVEARCQQTYGAVAVPAVSLADEIRKLADLRERGVLTDEEFDTQKLRLMLG